MIINKKTKIITTLGPASNSEKTIKDLFFAGMNTVRINLSHGTYETHKKNIDLVKKIRQELQEPISILLDTKGPEIRIGKFQNEFEKIQKNQKILIYSDVDSFKNKSCTQNEITMSYDISKDVQLNDIILIDDGKLQLQILNIKPGLIETKAINDHVLKSNKRVNIPSCIFSMPFLSEKDTADIHFAIEQNADFIAASFVGNKNDVLEIKKILNAKNANYIKIFSKIESQNGIQNIDEIILVSDGIMVARGDLGLEIPYYDVPFFQKKIIQKCRSVGKPVIVATQMLDSMEQNPFPTRAEVTDIYLATELGADATMLSGESAIGRYPVKSVATMSQINQRAEKDFYQKTNHLKNTNNLFFDNSKNTTQEIKNIILQIQNSDVKYIVLISKTGKLLNTISQLRPNANILGIIEDKNYIHKFGINSSVFVYPDSNIFQEIQLDNKHIKKVLQKFNLQIGDKYLLILNNNIKQYIF